MWLDNTSCEMSFLCDTHVIHSCEKHENDGSLFFFVITVLFFSNLYGYYPYSVMQEDKQREELGQDPSKNWFTSQPMELQDEMTQNAPAKTVSAARHKYREPKS